MKKVFKSAVMLMAAFMLPLGFTSCSSDDDPVENNDFTNKAYGQDAMDACDELCNALRAAYSKVNNANLSADQETYLKNVCANAVDNTIQPTYKSLADAVVVDTEGCTVFGCNFSFGRCAWALVDPTCVGKVV